MANLIIDEQLAERLAQVAERQHKPVEDVLAEALDLFEAKDDPLTPVQKVRRKLYAMARKYWREHNDTERLALTDEELDDQFWAFDNGVPRLKSEQGTVTLSPSPLLRLAELARDDPDGLWDNAPTNLSETVRETMDAHFRGIDGDPA